MLSERLSQVERIDWDTFLAQMNWRQGEHVTLIGPTGTGKTTLALALLPAREFVIFYGTKPKDATLDSLVREQGWRKVERHDRMPNVVNKRNGRIVFWPKFRTPDDQATQAYQIGMSMRQAFTEGGWCLVVDETHYMDHQLGLKKWMEALWTQGRSVKITVVAGTQRPAHISLMAYDQATHVFFWRDNDERNLKRISGLNGLNADLIRRTVATLPAHEVLYVNTRTGQMWVTKAPNRK